MFIKVDEEDLQMSVTNAINYKREFDLTIKIDNNRSNERHK